MKSGRAAIIDTMIPLVIPASGITRGELARKLRVSYADATVALERLRKLRLLKRHISKSRYVYRLTGSRRSLSVGLPSTIYQN